MLQLKTIHKDTFDLLEMLSEREELRYFSLADGTALALLLGHRVSVDLDFFTNCEFESSELLENLSGHFDIQDCSSSINSLSLSINHQRSSVKIDCIRHNYQILDPIIVAGKIRIFSLKDIAAMKLNAIANRGAKKDFYDIFALLTKFTLPELIGFFEQKYQKMNSFTVTKSLIYFDDADMDPDPISMMGMTWEDIKIGIKMKLISAV
jgi:hypothetical protein